MKKRNILVLILVSMFFTFTGCKKYEEGPSISPWPKKWRVVNEWTIEKSIFLGISTSGPVGYVIEFKGDGGVAQTGTFSLFTLTGESTWEWGDKKESITFSGSEWKILRLTSNEFWVSGLDGNQEIHFKSIK